MSEITNKKRISTLAKQYGVDSNFIIKLCNEKKIFVRSSSSMIDIDQFAEIKPALVVEKERLDRKEMAKAGIKIPMKVVLKKAPDPEPVVRKAVPERVAPPPEKPRASIPQKVQEIHAEIAHEIKPVSTPDPVILEVVQPAIVSEVKTHPEPSPVVELPKAPEVHSVVEEPKFTAPAAPEVPVSSAPVATPPEEKSESSLKVTVEKPDEKLAARIQKHLAEQAARKLEKRPRRGPGGPATTGYSGRFGKVPDGAAPRPPRPNTGRVGTGPGSTSAPSTGGNREFRPRDVFATRAQEIGALQIGAVPGKATENKKVQEYQKKKLSKLKSRKKKTKEQVEIELQAMKSNISKVMATVGRGSAKIKHKKDKKEDMGGEQLKILEVPEYITISELAGLMNIMPALVIAKCMELGMMVTINQRLDQETISIIADEFGFEVKQLEILEDSEEEIEEEEAEDNLVFRAPIVTIMGHVDHGKTSILDYIRKTRVVAGESGGITQHIGAYKVDTIHGPVCFLDTPGHQAFAAMRARGAQVTDIVVLVVAADSMVMPQTKEAIQHARNAGVQLVVAINKIDLPEANPDKIKAQLSEEGVQVTEWGGTVSCIEVSAKTGHNIDKLLETLALESEVMELKANPEKRGKGVVIETRLDRGRGTVVTLLVEDGTIRVGDSIVCGSYSGRVRSILDDKGFSLKEAGPSTPIQMLGLDGNPQAGDSFNVMADDREAREVANRRREAAKDRDMRTKRHVTLEQLHEQIKTGEFHELKIILKADVDGSVEAIAASLERLSTPEVKVVIIAQGVGAVKEADIHLAEASNALIIAFHVLPTESVRKMADDAGVTINYYRIIYEVVDDVKKAMEGMLNPEFVEKVTGEAKILQIFKVPKVGYIAGCLVNSGMVDRDSKVRLYREGIEVGEARVSSLKRHKDDVRSVKAGLECGIGIDGITDIKEDDILAFFKKEQIARKLTVNEFQNK